MKEYYNTREVDNDMKKLLLQRNKLNLKEDDYKDLIINNLGEATRIRLISDVPLGVLLSGGVDSSCVVAMASKFSDSALKTFSIGFEEQDYSELKYARIIANRFSTKHYGLSNGQIDLFKNPQEIPR